MTESTFPFDSADEEPRPGDRRKMTIVAGAGALAVAVLGYFVVVPMLSGSDTPTQTAIVRGKAPAAKTAAKPVAKKPAAQPATYADTSARKIGRAHV